MNIKKITYYIGASLIVLLSLFLTFIFALSIYLTHTSIATIDDQKKTVKQQESKIKEKQATKEKEENIQSKYQGKEAELKKLVELNANNKKTLKNIQSKTDDNKKLKDDIKSEQERLKEKKEKEAEEKQAKLDNQNKALSACTTSFSGIGTCEIKNDVLVITPNDIGIVVEAKYNTDSWKNLVKTTKRAAKSMIGYDVDGIAISNPANPDNVILAVSSLGFVTYNLANN